MKEIRLKARAKINITLDIVGKRDNGYHEVEMVMQTIDLYDKLLLKKQKKDTISLKTNLPYLPTDERNLVYKIIDYMKQTYNIRAGVYASLYKMIPVAAGMAGGSSDGAQTIIGMNRLFELNLNQNEMMKIGEKFGSDIPYCIVQGTALAAGLGEKITYLEPFPEVNVLIVKPRFSMSTKRVYEQFQLDEVQEHPNTQAVVQAIKNKDIDYICKHLVNVLETVTPKLHPEINGIKLYLKELGADGVLMSGSGPTVFGLFKKKKQAENALKCITKQNNMQFVYLTGIYNRKKG